LRRRGYIVGRVIVAIAEVSNAKYNDAAASNNASLSRLRC
jgi:hypothetical protein